MSMFGPLALSHYLILAAILFAIGIVGIFLNRKNLIVLLMAIEQKNDSATPRLVIQWAPARPMVLPKKPATMAPNSGASGMIR